MRLLSFCRVRIHIRTLPALLLALVLISAGCGAAGGSQAERSVTPSVSDGTQAPATSLSRPSGASSTPTVAAPSGSPSKAVPAAGAKAVVATPTHSGAESSLRTEGSRKKGRITAREAFDLAVAEIKNWHQGAKIAWVEPSGLSDDFDLFDGKSSVWQFICASPDGQQFRTFDVDTRSEPLHIRVADGELPLQPAMMDPSAWNVDSVTAYEIALANGLKKWLDRHPKFRGRDATLQLRGLEEIGPYWRIICQDGTKGIEFQISATDGQVHEAWSY